MPGSLSMPSSCWGSSGLWGWLYSSDHMLLRECVCVPTPHLRGRAPQSRGWLRQSYLWLSGADTHPEHRSSVWSTKTCWINEWNIDKLGSTFKTILWSGLHNSTSDKKAQPLGSAVGPESPTLMPSLFTEAPKQITRGNSNLFPRWSVAFKKHSLLLLFSH